MIGYGGEIKLENHMKWARILIANKGKSTPKEVAISQNGLKFYILIWSESKPRLEILLESIGGSAGEDDGWNLSINPITQRTKQNFLCNKISISHAFRDLIDREHVVVQRVDRWEVKKRQSHVHIMCKVLMKKGPWNNTLWTQQIKS